VDLCDLRYGEARRDAPDHCRVEETWSIVTRFAVPRPTLFVREITTFVRQDDGTWHRDDERHENVLLDTARIVELLAAHGLDVRVAESFGDEQNPEGLVALVGGRPA
jgi:hypothetical protein